MRRQTPIAHLLFDTLYPPHIRLPTDPPSFSAHLARNLVPEVRIEVATFYGDLNSTEARYPGLDYCYAPHRMRLGRFKHHRRLFDAFDSLGLTEGEIQDFCCWEGTKWARERYEKDEGIKVLDTTGDEIGRWVDRRGERGVVEVGGGGVGSSITRQTDISVVVEETTVAAEEDGEDGEDGEEEDGEEEDARRHIEEVTRRREQAITQRIIAAWEQGQSLPPEIEQYLKEQSERGTLSSAGLDLRAVMGRGNGRAEGAGYALMPVPDADRGANARARAAA